MRFLRDRDIAPRGSRDAYREKRIARMRIDDG